jgi:membrane protease YdiL (CAAX protease family)
MHVSFSQRRPILFSVAILAIVMVIYLIAGTVTYVFKLPTLATYIIGNSILAVVAVLLLSRLHWWRESGFRLPSRPHFLWLFIIPCLPVFSNAFSGIGYPGLAQLLLFFALALVVGFVEEAYFRGMILHALAPRGPWQAVIVSSILFGIGHLFNLAGGASLEATLFQIVYALAIGLMYAALRLRTQTLLPLILLHGLTDFFGFLAQNSAVEANNLSVLSVVIIVGEIVIYTVYCIILMRQVKPQPLRTNTRQRSIPPL